MGNAAIVGINWGDEGKGRMVDLLTNSYDVVVRYQGGGNAGHTVVNEHGKFALHLLPSGIFREGVMNVLGNGVALDPENLWKEIEQITSQGVSITPENLMISDRASLLLPWHRELDGLEEARLADKKFGSTKQGIAPFYADKFAKKTILAGELLYSKHLREHLQDLMEWKNLTLTRVYGAKPVTMEELEVWINVFCNKIKPFIRDTGAYLRQAQQDGKKILFEAQLGALRDLDYGIHPYTTSSNPIAAYAPVGSGLPCVKIDEVVGVVKAYSSCVGEGPFVCEMFGDEAEELRKAGFEDGAKTGAAGAIWKIAYLSDGAYLAGTDEYLNILSGDETLREDGTLIGVKELELTEKLKNETSIAIEFVLYRATEYDFFDGKRWVQSAEDRTEQRIRVDVPLNANEKAAVYHAERTFSTYSVAVDVTISDVKIHVKANLKSLNGHPLGREKWIPGEMMDGGLYLDGQPMHMISGMDEGLETSEWTMENDYTRPEQLPEKLEWIPCYYTETGTEDRPEETVTIWLTQP